jgi:hypothetical protein
MLNWNVKCLTCFHSWRVWNRGNWSYATEGENKYVEVVTTFIVDGVLCFGTPQNYVSLARLEIFTAMKSHIVVWRWRQCGPLKCWYPTTLHAVTTQNTMTWNFCYLLSTLVWSWSCTIILLMKFSQSPGKQQISIILLLFRSCISFHIILLKILIVGIKRSLPLTQNPKSMLGSHTNHRFY